MKIEIRIVNKIDERLTHSRVQIQIAIRVVQNGIRRQAPAAALLALAMSILFAAACIGAFWPQAYALASQDEAREALAPGSAALADAVPLDGVQLPSGYRLDIDFARQGSSTSKTVADARGNLAEPLDQAAPQSSLAPQGQAKPQNSLDPQDQAAPQSSLNPQDQPTRTSPLKAQDDSAEIKTSGNWRYTTADGGVCIVGYSGTANSLTIPDTLAGKKVVQVGYDESYDDDRNGVWGNATSIKLGKNVNAIGYNTFCNCTNLTNVDTSAAPLTGIGQDAFANTGITSLTLPKTLTSLGDTALDGMYELRDLYLSANLEPLHSGHWIAAGSARWTADEYYNLAPRSPKVAYHVPSGCKNYKVTDGVLYSKDGKVLYSRPVAQSGESFTVPSSVRYIADYAFFGSENLKSVKLNAGLYSIGSCAFSLSALESVTIPSSVRVVDSWCFNNCSSLAKVTFEDGMVDLWNMGAQGQFYDCPSLASVRLPETLTRVSNTCFANTALTSIDIPAKVKEVNYAAFADIPTLARVTGCEGLQKINNIAFRYTGISGFPFGKNLKFVSGLAFYGCENFPNPNIPSYLSKDASGDYWRFDGPLYVKGTDNYDYAFKVLALVNKERAKQKLPALKMDADLLKAAMQRASEVAVLFEHTRPTGQDCFSASPKMSGENIAVYQSSPASVMKTWMNSPGHKANIMSSDFKSIGVGCFVQNGAYCWVQAFGSEAASPVATKTANKTVTHAVNLFPADQKIKLKMESSASAKVGAASTLTVRSNEDWALARMLAKSFTWSSSNTKIATVSAAGKVSFKKVGTVKITAKVKNSSQKVTRTFKVAKGKQPLVLKLAKKQVKLKAKSLAKKKAVIKGAVKASKARGKVTYKNASTKKAAKKLKVNAKNGTITVPKGTKKGTYSVKVKATAKGNSNYASGSKTVTVKVVVS